MEAITLSDARKRLTEVADQAEANPVFITRSGADTLVLMNAADLTSIMETAHLLSTKANRDSLTRSLEQLRKGRVVTVSVDDL